VDIVREAAHPYAGRVGSVPATSVSGTSPRWWRGPDAPRNLADIVVENARRTPDRVILQRRHGSAWDPVTARAFARQVSRLALGFVAAGVQQGDRVALMGRTRYEWTLVDAALWHVGAVTVPVYETSSPEQLRWVLEDSGAVGCVVETASHARVLAGMADNLPALRLSWVIDDVAGHDHLDDLVALGRQEDLDELDRRRAALGPDTLLTIIYTSGTTGRPRGCELTHGNFLSEVTSAIEALPELFEHDEAATLLFLPLAHVFGRMIQVAVLLAGVRTGHSDVGRVTKDLPTFRPTFVLAVPRVFERIFDTARRKAVAAGRGRIFGWATDAAIAQSTALESGRPGLALRARHAVFERLVYARIREAFGGELQWAVSGGAPLGARLGHFFRGIGVTVLEGYGLTETTAAVTVNARAATRIGTVGRTLPGVELRIGAGGVIEVRAANVFRGYWHDPAASEAALTDDGWFSTGDLGALEDGYLRITGRAKEILVTSSGKNVSPAPLEDLLRGNVLVSQALVVGDGRPSVGALVTLDEDAVANWLSDQGRPPTPLTQLTDDPALLAEIRSAVEAANATVSSAEAIGRFRVLATDLTEQSGHLTPTLKVKRNVVLADFADEVEALYAKRA
jgi:long-chain acyl-CoA synthetase